MVSSVSVLIRVRLPSDEPGSLKAMWPSEPMPSICRSMPPPSAIRCSYHSQNASKSSARPSGMWMSLGSMLMWLNRFSCMK